MKLCSLAPPFETVLSGAKRRARAQFQWRARQGTVSTDLLATLLHEGENMVFEKT